MIIADTSPLENFFVEHGISAWGLAEEAVYDDDDDDVEDVARAIVACQRGSLDPTDEALAGMWMFLVNFAGARALMASQRQWFAQQEASR